MDTAALINLCLREYARATTDSVARAKTLDWLNIAEKTVLSKAPDWWFLYEEDDFDFVIAQAAYSVPPEWEEVVDLQWGLDYAPMTRLTELTYNALLRPYASATGVPTHWSAQSRTENTQVLNVHVWPTPSANKTGVARVRLYPAALSDSSSSYSRIPEAHRMILIDYARAEMKRDDGDLNKAQMYMLEGDKKLEALLADQQRRMGRT